MGAKGKLQNEGAGKPDSEHQQTIAFSRSAASKVDLSEIDTRKLIDQQTQSGGLGSKLSKRLGVSQPSVSISVKRGEKIAKAELLDLGEE